VAYPAVTFTVMLAAPSDLKDQLGAMREVVLKWSSVHSRSRQVVLLPMDYVHDTYPEVQERPQDAVNRQLLDKCDILVAAFWTKLGTPTGASESGTVEEIERHVDADKPAMLYFSNASPDLAKIDTGQLDAVRTFKNKMQSQAFYGEFDSTDDLRSKLTSHLATLMNEHPHIQSLLKQYSALQIQVMNPKQDLSVTAKRMLAAAAAKDGQIHRLAALQGNYVSYRAGKPTFGSPGDPRSQADAQAALDELVTAGLAQDESGHHGLYKLTPRGYDVADELPF
jgi:hypothetical protein